MFRRVNSQHVEHSDGYSLRSVDRFTMEYREGPRRLELGQIASPEQMSLWCAKDTRWKWPHEDEIISQERCDQIRERVIDALRAMNDPSGDADLRRIPDEWSSAGN